MRLPWERRHRDGRRSDFREGGVTGTGGGRTSVTIVPVRIPHLGPIGDEDAGNVTLSGPGRPFSGRIRGVGNALRGFTLLWHGQSTQRVGHCWTTRKEAWSSRSLRDDARPSVTVPCHSRRPPVTLPSRILHASHTRPSRHGHSLPRAVARRPGPLPRPSEGRVPSRRRLAGSRTFPGASLRAPAAKTPHPFPIRGDREGIVPELRGPRAPRAEVLTPSERLVTRAHKPSRTAGTRSSPSLREEGVRTSALRAKTVPRPPKPSLGRFIPCSSPQAP